MLREVDEQYEHQKMFWMTKKKRDIFYSVERARNIRGVKVGWNKILKKGKSHKSISVEK